MTSDSKTIANVRRAIDRWSVFRFGRDHLDKLNIDTRQWPDELIVWADGEIDRRFAEVVKRHFDLWSSDVVSISGCLPAIRLSVFWEAVERAKSLAIAESPTLKAEHQAA